MTGPAVPALDEVLAVLGEHGHQLDEYHAEILQRRLAEHVGDHPTGGGAAFLDGLRTDAAERDRLLEAFLVSHTSFFRHAALFHVLREQGLASLGAAVGGGTFRVWVAGVATGEEAWSIAMLLAEAEARGGPRWEVIASDRRAEPLAVATRARYPLAAGAAIPADLRGEYTRTDGDQLEIVATLRSRVRFAQHDLLGPWLAPADAVLARFDLVLCCNVLIYLEHQLQARVIDRLIAVLAPTGALALGQHERLPAELAPRLRPYPDLAQPVHLFARAVMS